MMEYGFCGIFAIVLIVAALAYYFTSEYLKDLEDLDDDKDDRNYK